ncbi:hypothetical protein [Brachyspira aalborgi]|uniref:hypothetical protein n=1 Tax=Brachyspira aalborgi TaxID=29522 RepID=UPI0013157F86|nr:hypothetical protein [Brachyspira aalborgi]
MYSNVFSSEIRQQNRTEQNRTEQNRTEQNRTEQNRTEQNRTEQNRTEQNRTLTGLPSVAEQNYYKAYFNCKTKSCKVYFSRLIGLLLIIRNKILSLIILNFFMPFSKFLNAHPSGHKARGYAFLSLSNTGFDFRTTPLLFNFKIKKIFFALLSFFILFTISCGNENKTKNEIYERNISYYTGDWINSDTKEKIFIINSDGSIIVNGENILPKSIKKNSETNYTFKVMPEWINKSSYTFNINFINDAKGKVNVGNLYFEINKIN